MLAYIHAQSLACPKSQLLRIRETSDHNISFQEDFWAAFKNLPDTL